jgi:hypothetical protein
MHSQAARPVPFRPEFCPICVHFDARLNRCRGFAASAWPRPILAIFDGESTSICERFSPRDTRTGSWNTEGTMESSTRGAPGSAEDDAPGKVEEAIHLQPE